MKTQKDKENERLSALCTVGLAIIVGAVILGSVIINHALHQAEKEIQKVIGECHESVIR